MFLSCIVRWAVLCNDFLIITDQVASLGVPLHTVFRLTPIAYGKETTNIDILKTYKASWLML